MTFVVIVGGLLLLAMAVAVVAWPLLRERRDGQAVYEAELTADAVLELDPLVELQEQRDAVYQAIKDLEFDHQVGKVAEADYQAFDAQLKEQAVGILKQIDALRAAEADPQLGLRLEAEIAALRRVDGYAPTAASVAAASTKFCPQCGRPCAPGDRFCGGCGTALA